jgi:hypothetical protein
MPGPSDMSKATRGETPAGFPSTYWVTIPIPTGVNLPHSAKRRNP